MKARTTWVAITPQGSAKFLDEEAARAWIDATWADQPRVDAITLMRVERYETIIYRPGRARRAARRSRAVSQ